MNEATRLHHRAEQEKFQRLLTDPNMYVPMGLLQLMSSFAVVSSGWSLDMIIQFYVVLPAVVAFAISAIVAHTDLVVRLYKAEPGLRLEVLKRAHWAYVCDSLLLGFFAGIEFVMWAQSLPR